MKRAALLRRVLADCYCQLRPSGIHGIGVFAIRDIPKDRNPFKTLPKYTTTGFVRATEEELAALPPKLGALIRALFVPTAGKMYVPTCGLNIIYLDTYLNHSPRPNLRTKDGARFLTTRLIREGDELTVDYRTYGARLLRGYEVGQSGRSRRQYCDRALRGAAKATTSSRDAPA